MVKPILDVPAPSRRGQRATIRFPPSPFSTDWYAQVKLGLIPGFELYHQFGRNSSVGPTWEPVSLLGSYAWQLQVPVSVRVKAGGSAGDDIAGAGARQLFVAGFDDTFTDIIEEIDLAGASASVATTASFWRVYRAAVTSAGVYSGQNLADITLQTSDGAADLLLVPQGEGQSQFATYTVPDGSVAYIPSYEFSGSAKKEFDIRLRSQFDIDTVVAPFGPTLTRRAWIGTEGDVLSNMQAPIGPFPARSDLWFETQAPAGGSDVDVSITFEVLLQRSVDTAVAQAARTVGFEIPIP